MRSWWSYVTCNSKAFEKIFEAAIEEETEKFLATRENQNPCEIILSMLMKLILLGEVFLDKDYIGGTMCLIPFQYEPLFVKIISLSVEKFPVKKLMLCGPMYPGITEAILKNAPHLESLVMSHNVITNEVLVCAGENCQNLKSLVIIHYNITSALSTDAIIQGLFVNSSKNLLKESLKEAKVVPVSLPNLQRLDIFGFNAAYYQYDLFSWILFHYQSLANLCVDWRSDLFSDMGDETIFYQTLIDLAVKKNKVFKLKDFVLTTTLAMEKLSERVTTRLVESFPFVQRLFINLHYIESTGSNELKNGGVNIATLAKVFDQLNYLYIKCYSNLETVNLTIMPSLQSIGNKIQTLILDWDNQDQRCPIDLIYELCSNCTCLKILKLKFDTRCDIDYSKLQEENNFYFPLKHLKELWLHEMCPWNAPKNVTESHIDSANWLKLLQFLLISSPELEILSITVSAPTMSVLRILTSSVSTFHLHVKDAFELESLFELLVAMVKRFSKLNKIFLEEIEVDDFWDLKSAFKTSALEMNWGNLDGWPRT